MRRMLLLADTAGLACAVGLALLAGIFTPVLLLSWPLFVVWGNMYGLYGGDEERAHYTTVDDLAGIFNTVTTTAFILLLLSLSFGTPIGTAEIASFWACSFVLVMSCRFAGRGLTRRTATYRQDTIIVGAGDVGQLIGRKIMQHPEYGINLIGFVDSNPKTQRVDLGDMTILGGADELNQIVSGYDVERVVVAFSGETNEETLNLVRSLRNMDVQIDIVPRLFEAVGPSADIHTIEGLPLVGLPSVRITRASRWAKRTVDVLFATGLIILTSPLQAYIAGRVRMSSQGSVLFRQERLGMNLKPFEMLKFRTMHADTDPDVHRDYIERAMGPTLAPNNNGLYKLERRDAITSVGRWLRRTSLDELPQLWNVLRGDMSLVGPRPCIEYETEFFEPHHFERFLVPQGITGLWQVEGRALMTPREALDLDVAYARGWSLRLDFSLLTRTFWQVIFRKGAA